MGNEHTDTLSDSSSESTSSNINPTEEKSDVNKIEEKTDIKDCSQSDIDNNDNFTYSTTDQKSSTATLSSEKKSFTQSAVNLSGVIECSQSVRIEKNL